MAEGRFVLVYHEDMIANHSSVWNNDVTLATWLRLLALYDKMWPSSAELPRGTNKPAVDRLVKAGLIKTVGAFGYFIPSLDKRRTAARNAASNAARIRYGTAPRNAKSNAYQTRPDKDHISAIGKAVDEEVPFVALTKEQQAEALQREQDELMKKIGWKVGVAE